MNKFLLNFDETQATLLLQLLSGKRLVAPEYRELIPLLVELEKQLGASKEYKDE